jgi:hypothetical protein
MKKEKENKNLLRVNHFPQRVFSSWWNSAVALIGERATEEQMRFVGDL